MADLIKTIRIECTRDGKTALFELSEKLYFYFYTLQSVEIYQSKASRQFAQPSLLRLGEKKAKTKTTI